MRVGGERREYVWNFKLCVKRKNWIFLFVKGFKGVIWEIYKILKYKVEFLDRNVRLLYLSL